MQKILVVLTNVSKYEKNNIPTGLWLGELTHFYDEVSRCGFTVDFVSPHGGYIPIDPYSLKFLNEIDYKWYQNPEFTRNALANTKRPSDINPNDYSAIYYTGGHGVLWDFPNNQEIKHIAETIYQNGGYITAVCHGVVGLLNLKDEQGNYIIQGKKVTGFTNTEERLSQKQNQVPFSTEVALKKRGALYMKKRFFKSFAVRDGRVITGQNPWSPRAVAQLLVNALTN